ncbi:hypothetical protein M3P19_00685 [Muricauda sp. 2012CJ35-5]|uniref:DUF4292 domain-containing protein n=1 Tax=Flagellimonas spongiicola TaxID=2942208 RepID=A0ABT0PM72_9FLAO|nr:hypothetical protein [Allomuricauda spongiicola]MCL6272500.1 hypothetical protein [Allomuricauda spongiicola]
MKKIIVTLAIGGVLCASCSEKNSKFLIGEGSIGTLTKKTAISELETVFAQDSIVRDSARIKLGANSKKIEIYEKGGAHLLTLTPNTDSIPTIENVRVLDSRYVSDRGISLNSTFEEVQTKYGIKKIVTTLNSIVVFPKSSNLYFTIDKEELPSNLRYTTSNIESVQIPATAKIKYLMIGWE